MNLPSHPDVVKLISTDSVLSRLSYDLSKVKTIVTVVAGGMTAGVVKVCVDTLLVGPEFQIVAPARSICINFRVLSLPVWWPLS